VLSEDSLQLAVGSRKA